MTSQCKTDARARVALPEDFANATVTVERVSADEVRVRRVKRRRYTFKELMAGVTRENIHAPIDTGPPVGREAL
jgi:antitoxin component of MazEF toxin-antitoxin module